MKYISDSSLFREALVRHQLTAFVALGILVMPDLLSAAWMNPRPFVRCDPMRQSSIKVSTTEKHRLEIIPGVGKNGGNKRVFALMARPNAGSVPNKESLEYILEHNGKIEDSGKVTADAISIATRATGRYELYVVRVKPDGSKEQITNTATFDVRFVK